LQTAARSRCGFCVPRTGWASEEITGHDLIAWQLRVAAGEGFSGIEQQDIERLLAALEQFVIHGPKTTLELARALISHTDFRNNRLSTRWLEDRGLPDFNATVAAIANRR
jgi:biotin carboxylase